MRRYACDTEVYGNYFLAAFKDIESGQERSWEAVDGRLTKRQRRTLLEFLKSILSVTFNGNDFDLPILAAAIAGKDTEQLKTIADDIIVAGFKPWDVEREHKIRLIQINHIDLIEVAPGQASLKIYNGRMHGKRMQDLLTTRRRSSRTRKSITFSTIVSTISTPRLTSTKRSPNKSTSARR